MAYLRTLAELRISIRNQADFRNDDDNYENDYVDDDELNDYINTSIGWIHGMKTQSGLSYDESEEPYTTTTSPTYPLPDDFYAPIGVDVLINGYWWSILKLEQRERNMFQNTSNTYPSAYRIVGENLVLYPTPGAGQSVKLIYVPSPTVLVDDEDTYDFGNTWNELLEVDCCIKLLQKEESATGGFERRKQELLDRIRVEVEHRALTEPHRVVERSRRISGIWGGTEYDYDDDWYY